MTESTIDMDRAMQGIDCEVITWTKCSDRMPPDDKDKRYILTNLNCPVAEPLIYTGHTVNMLGIIPGDVWTPYTPESWAELNK